MEEKIRELNRILFCALSEHSTLEESFEYYQAAVSLSKDIEESLEQYNSKIDSLMRCTDIV